MSFERLRITKPIDYGSVVISVDGNNHHSQQPSLASDTTHSQNSYVSFYSYPAYIDDEDYDDYEPEKDYKTLFKEHCVATPFIILAVSLFVLPTVYWHSFQWDSLCMGLAGWTAARLLIKPVDWLFSTLLRRQLSTNSLFLNVTFGILEESIRLELILLNFAETDFLFAYWLGLGWASAEAICYIIRHFKEIRLYKEDVDTDFKARDAIEDTLGKPLNTLSAWWGVMWTLSTTMLNIGLSCWIYSSSTLVYAAAILHATLYVIWANCLPSWGIPTTSYRMLITSMAVFLVGLALLGVIE
ncbi:2061_t:CDS:1 [Paraglomus brasilianum]|uniref:2061_t:CDS:1 n=1 Tax=Paraglomus brasilianum TaxID=144538 RepID=A0A9N9ATW0_9GLOM|nr:2061_t:CDS:1 [Paraglomus brasilianum]